MGFPIRFKLKHKQTGLSFKEWAKQTKTSNAGDRFGSPFQIMPCLNEDGVPLFVNFENFYLGQGFLSPKDWELWAALEKDGQGRWIYKQVGY